MMNQLALIRRKAHGTQKW